MKKALSSVLAILLTLAMVGMFAACKDKPEDPTDPEITTEVTTEAPDTTTEDIITEDTDEPSTDEANAGVATTEAPDNTADADPYLPPENLGSLGKTEQLAYFNLVANRVRTDKPGFTKEFSKVISDLTFTGVVRLVQGIVDSIVAGLTGPEDPKVLAQGADNRGDFLSEITPFELRPGDVSSINSKKSGDNWIMTVKIIPETNPAKPTGSANARAYPIASRQEVLDEIVGFSSAISADPNDATLRYNSGTINLTVNSKGQVTAMDYMCLVNATADNVSISILTTNVTAKMTITGSAHSFKW